MTAPCSLGSRSTIKSPDRSVSEVEPRWGVGDAVLAVFVSYGISSIVFLAIGSPKSTTISQNCLLTLPFWILAIAVPIWATVTKGNGPAVDLGLRIRPLDVLIGAGLGVFAQYAVGWGYQLVTSDEMVRKLSKPAETLAASAADSWGKVLLVVTTVVVAPIAEELLYRGLLLRSLERRFSSAGASRVVAVGGAVVLTGLVFALMHFQVLQFAGLALFGILCGSLAVKTGRLAPAMAAHIAFNATAVAHLHLW